MASPTSIISSIATIAVVTTVGWSFAQNSDQSSYPSSDKSTTQASQDTGRIVPAATQPTQGNDGSASTTQASQGGVNPAGSQGADASSASNPTTLAQAPASPSAAPSTSPASPSSTAQSSGTTTGSTADSGTPSERAARPDRN
jgi:hypothetical protein